MNTHKFFSQFMLRIIVAVSMLIGVSSCAEITAGAVASGLVQTPKVSIQNVAINDISLSHVDINLNLAVDNPNPFGFNVAGIDYQLLINGNSLVSGSQNDGINIPNQGKNTMSLPLRFRYSDLMRLAQSQTSLGAFNYQFVTQTHVMLPYLGRVSLPSDYKGQWKVSDFLSVF